MGWHRRGTIRRHCRTGDEEECIFKVQSEKTAQRCKMSAPHWGWEDGGSLWMLNKRINPQSVFPRSFCPDVNFHSGPQLWQSKPLCGSSFLPDTCVSLPQRELWGTYMKKIWSLWIQLWSVKTRHCCFFQPLVSWWTPWRKQQNDWFRGSCPEQKPLVCLSLHAHSRTWIEMVLQVSIPTKEDKETKGVFLQCSQRVWTWTLLHK